LVTGNTALGAVFVAIGAAFVAISMSRSKDDGQGI